MSKLFTMKNKNKLLDCPINVLSLFDGISCGHVALDRAGIQIKNYYASEINSDSIKVTNYNLVSAQNRNRLYWTNITGVSQPKDFNIVLQDILQSDDETFSYILKDGRLKWLKSKSGINCISSRYASLDATKANCLTARGEKSWNCNYVTRKDGKIRTLTPIEYERLQTLPDNYTSIISDSSRYEALGNGWTVDVISHILSYVSQKGIYL